MAGVNAGREPSGGDGKPGGCHQPCPTHGCGPTTIGSQGHNGEPCSLHSAGNLTAVSPLNRPIRSPRLSPAAEERFLEELNQNQRSIGCHT